MKSVPFLLAISLAADPCVAFILSVIYSTCKSEEKLLKYHQKNKEKKNFVEIFEIQKL